MIFTLAFIIFSFNTSSVDSVLAGTWKGFNDVPTGLGALELTFGRQGTEWQAVCKFPEIDGENTFPIHDLTVNDTDISFQIEVEAESRQMRFSGRLAGDKLEGTYEMFRAGSRVYTGEWSVRRAQPEAKGARVPAHTVQSDNRTSRRPQSEQGDRNRAAELPAPTGPSIVGRATFYWKDPARPETLTDDRNDRRQLMVTLWYPARKVTGLAPAVYFPSYKLIAGQSSAPLPASRKTDAFERAPLAGAPRTFPVLLFSHGLGENTARYSAQLEDLASHGYVVAAIDHTYDNEGTVFPDGRIARYSERWEWAFDGEDVERERFIRAQLRVMVEDVSFVVNQLSTLNGEPSSAFKGALNVADLGFFGHSLGGAIAPLVCQADKRFKACLNQDGLLLGQALILDPEGGKLERPFMFLGHSDSVAEETLRLMALTRTEYEEHDRARRRRAYRVLDTIPFESYVIAVNGAAHSSFTDRPLLEANNTTTRYADRVRTLQAIRDYTRAFFDQYLLAKHPRLLAQTTNVYPEVVVEHFGLRRFSRGR
jgi:predicted dienelactone hydrolase